MNYDLLSIDALGQAELIKEAKVSPREVLEASIASIEAINPVLNAVIHQRFEAALQEADTNENLDQPFFGVPLLLKDLGGLMRGEPHYGGTNLLKEIDWRSPIDSFLVSAFKRAGFIVLGRTNCPELGSTITTEPRSYGPTRNPWNTEYSPGGSSGGSAAAVSSGMVAVAHANDGGGSIRIPASCCGLVGLKPSRGRVSQGPLMADAWNGATIDHVLTRSVRDSAAVLDAISGYRTGDPFTPWLPPYSYFDSAKTKPRRMKVALLDHPAIAGRKPDPDCQAAVYSAGAILEELGHEVTEAHPKAMEEEEFQTTFTTIAACWVAADLENFSTLLGRKVEPNEFEPENEYLATWGRNSSAATYLKATTWIAAFRRRMLSFWEEDGFDILLTPTLARPPAPLGYLSDPRLWMERTFDYIQFTPQFNATGQPAISLPLYMTAEGLPIGVQLVGGFAKEHELISLAAEIEGARPWKGIKPKVCAY
jgi:amidase